jgi:hypothetical protein
MRVAASPGDSMPLEKPLRPDRSSATISRHSRRVAGVGPRVTVLTLTAALLLLSRCSDAPASGSLAVPPDVAPTYTCTPRVVEDAWITYPALGEGEHGVRGLIPDGGGLVVVGGRGAAPAGTTLWIAKLEPSGAVVWESGYGPGFLEGGAVASDGGILGVGADFGPGRDLANVVVRVDGDGALMWRRELGDPNAAFFAAVSIDGGWVVASSAFYIDSRLTRLDDDGAVVWASEHGDFRGSPGALAQLSDGGICAGGFQGDQAIVIRADANGAPVWQRIFEGPRDDDTWVESVAAGPDGACVAAGLLRIDGVAGWDVALLDAAGGVVWHRDLKEWLAPAEPFPYSLETDQVVTVPGGFALGGTRDILTPDGWSLDHWIIRTDASGHPMWQTAVLADAAFGKGVRLASVGDGQLAMQGHRDPALTGTHDPRIGEGDVWMLVSHWGPEECIKDD